MAVLFFLVTVCDVLCTITTPPLLFLPPFNLLKHEVVLYIGSAILACVSLYTVNRKSVSHHQDLSIDMYLQHIQYLFVFSHSHSDSSQQQNVLRQKEMLI